jgi:hypothetical protein
MVRRGNAGRALTLTLVSKGAPSFVRLSQNKADRGIPTIQSDKKPRWNFMSTPVTGP